MGRITPEQAAIAMEIEHFMADYWEEIDLRGHASVQNFWFEDGHFTAGTAVDLHGVESMVAFYAERRALVANGPGGVRTSRHTTTNPRYTFHGSNEVECITTLVNYSGAGAPPMSGSSPTAVCDVYYRVQRDRNGDWRLKRLKADFIFLGDDPFQNKRMMGSEKPV